MTSLRAPQRRSDFRVAIICALPLEADKVQSVLSKCWDDEGQQYGKASGDQNVYTTGVIGGHNVVLAHMPGMGGTTAALVAANLRSSYTKIQLALVVGICGIVPFDTKTYEEIILGDVVVGTAVVQYDFGRQYPDGFERKQEIENSLAGASFEIQAFLNKLQTRRGRRRLVDALQHFLQSDDFQTDDPTCQYPGTDNDKLYDALYSHRHRRAESCSQCRNNLDTCSRSCEELGCENERLVARARHGKPTNYPFIHFGRFGSANKVMKSGVHRDSIAKTDNLIAFEMEGAGVCNQLPTIVIKAACDYADSHKNKQWQGYAATMAAAFVKVFLEEWGMGQDTSEDDTPGPVWHMPFERIPGFVGREEEVQRIKQMITDEGDQRISILGLGGVGKSRLVVELAYQVRVEYPHLSIFWVQAADQSTFERDWLEIGKKLGIPGIDVEGADIKTLVKERLSVPGAEKWLMILDNADDETLWTKQPSTSLIEYLPWTMHGSTVITTRTGAIAACLAGKCVVELHEMSSEQAVELLTRGIGTLSTQTACQNPLPDMYLLAEKLAYLPLALIQAVSFINRNRIPVSTYQKLLEDRDEDHTMKLLGRDFEEPTGHRYALQPVATTWLISFQQIRDRHPLALEYMVCMASLCEKNIPLSLLPRNSPVDTTETMGVLTGYSFVRQQSGRNTDGLTEPIYDMHRLVHLCTRHWLKQQGLFVKKSIENLEHLNKIFPRKRYKYKDQWKLFSVHAQRLCADESVVEAPARYELMDRTAWFLSRVDGNYGKVASIQGAILEWNKKTMGPSSPCTLRAYPELAVTLIQLGQYSKAHQLVQFAVENQTHILGKDHYDTLSSMSTLATVHTHQGQLREAEQLHMQVVQACQANLGVDNPYTQASMSQLAITYEHQGRWEDAEQLWTKLFEIQRRVLEPEHPDLLDTASCLARIYSRLGRLQEADGLQRQLLATRQRVLGPEHPETLITQGNLAVTCCERGQYTEAEELQTQLLAAQSRLLGDKHPQTLASVSVLSTIYRRQGRLQQSETIKTKLLETQKRFLGPEHPNTLSNMHNLASMMWARQRYGEAITLMSTCVEARLRTIGADHPYTKETLRILEQWKRAHGHPSPSSSPFPF